jgi:hypothetical protein
MARGSLPGRGPGRLHLDEGRRLIAACGGDAGDAAAVGDAVQTICRHVSAHLKPLIGPRATQALLARAVYLAKPHFEVLSAVSTAEADADVERELPVCLRGAQADQAREVAVSVLGNFVWLLTRFISEDFGLRLLREACPNPDEDHS